MPKKGVKVRSNGRKAKPKQRPAAPRKGGGRAKQLAPQRRMLDGAAVAYAQLLRDPCNGPLVGFFGGTGGYVQRFSSTFSIGNTAGTTAGIFSVLPGNGALIGGFETTADNVAPTTFTYSATSFPGFQFIQNTAKGYRVLACCIKLYSNASEQARTGYISYGNLAQSEMPQQVTAFSSPAAASTVLPVTVRTPTDCVEIKWFPGDDDVTYNGSMGISDSEGADNQGIMVVYTGQPTAVGFKVVITAVIEWLPNVTNGFVSNAMRPPPSSSSINDVKRALAMSDPNWWHSAGQILVRTTKSAVAGYSRGGMLGGIVGGIQALVM